MMEVIGFGGVGKQVLIKCSVDDIIKDLKKLGCTGTSLFLGSGI